MDMENDVLNEIRELINQYYGISTATVLDNTVIGMHSGITLNNRMTIYKDKKAVTVFYHCTLRN